MELEAVIVVLSVSEKVPATTDVVEDVVVAVAVSEICIVEVVEAP